MATAMAKAIVAVLALSWVLCAVPLVVAFVPNDAAAVAAKSSAARSVAVPPSIPRIHSVSGSQTDPIGLRMGLFDSVLSRFKGSNNSDEEGDFVKLEEMSQTFLGPGPVVLLYQVPDGIDDDEVRDMLADGAPKATKKGISMARIASLEENPSGTSEDSSSSSSSSSLVDLSLQEALETVIETRPPPTSQQTRSVPISPSFRPPTPMNGSPVVIFSGFTNAEMMDSYNILGEELYKETASYGRGQYLACATAVPNAMNKPLKQVLMEISGDHAEAMQQRQPKE